MSTFTVSSVTDGDTFEVKGGWEWEKSDGKVAKGTAVRPTGFDTPERGKPGYEAAKQKLKNLIEGKAVELKNPVDISYGRLVCDVYYNGKLLSSYFKVYQ